MRRLLPTTRGFHKAGKRDSKPDRKKGFKQQVIDDIHETEHAFELARARAEDDMANKWIPDDAVKDWAKQGNETAKRSHEYYLTHNPTPTKKAKTSKAVTPSPVKSTKSSVPTMKRSFRRNRRRRMPLRRRVGKKMRRYARRPRSARTGSRRLVAMIKKVAISTMEARRHVVTQASTVIPLNQIRTFALNRIQQVQGQTSEVNALTSFSGKEIYMRGMRMRCFLRNPTQYAVRYTLEIVHNKVATGAQVDMANDAAVNAATFWHNPIDGKETSYANIPNLFQLTASRQKDSNVVTRKRMVVVLHASQRGEGAPVTTGEAFQAAPDADMRDQAWLDFYVPINRKIKKRQDQVTLGVPAIFETDYALWVRAEPMHEDVNFAALLTPQIAFTSICYFRD